MLSAKAQPGLVFNISEGGSNPSWTHGELCIKTETAARTFSESLQRRELLKAAAGDPNSKQHNFLVPNNN